MKKLLLGAVLFLSIAAVASQNKDLVAKGLRFVAPAVDSWGNVYKPEEGEIIYQASDKQFYGNHGTEGWQKLSAGESILPPGVILPFGGQSAPSGFLLADGAAYLRADHQELFQAIGTNFGDGTKNADGSASGYAADTAFNVPDMRGRFMRGIDGTAGRDPGKLGRLAANQGGLTGNNIGSVQDQATRKNGLSLNDPGHAHGITSMINNFNGPNSVVKGGSNQGSDVVTNWAYTGINLNNGDAETRPVNIYVNHIIKL